MKILVTGGLGYIGSHTSVELMHQKYEIILVDNLCNSNEKVLENIKKITQVMPQFYKIDLTDKVALEKIFKENTLDVVIHFAGLKAVGESVKKPIKYYTNNLISTLNLLEMMQKYHVKKLVFSSSATVYGNPGNPKYTESMGRGQTVNPYGSIKSMIEQILEDLYASDNRWCIAILRYFNPIGAHESGLLGETPNGIPNNLMPYIMQVASGKRKFLNIFGNDYPTKDGTGVRDFIHVVDVAKGHVKALEKIKKEGHGIYTYNLGNGIGYSVMDLVNTFERVNGVKIPYKITARREGDLAEYFADPTKAKEELHWETEKTIEDMCRDSWNYEKNN